MSAQTIESRLRRFLFALATFIFLGTIVELVLEDHNQEALQLIPFVLSGISVIALAAAQIRPQRLTLLALRGALALTAAGGLLGMGLHLVKNYQFELEVRPTSDLMELISHTLKGANPLFAPGILVFAALIALAATYYHPVLGKRSAE